jgi:hypothetical protein
MPEVPDELVRNDHWTKGSTTYTMLLLLLQMIIFEDDDYKDDGEQLDKTFHQARV